MTDCYCIYSMLKRLISCICEVYISAKTLWQVVFCDDIFANQIFLLDTNLNLMDLTKGLFLLFVFFNQAEKCRIVGVPGYVFGSRSATV